MTSDCPFPDKPVIKYLGRYCPPELVSCPTCGRTHLRDELGNTTPFIEWAEQVRKALNSLHRPIKIAVMGCEVNGPGEAKDADLGIALGEGRAAIFRHGKVIRTIPLSQAMDVLIEEAQRTW